VIVFGALASTPEAIDLPADQALGVWHDLECALAGKNGYGGDVAEIYAYLLVSDGFRRLTDPAFISGATEEQARLNEAEVARIAARNLTLILRQFVELHEGVEIKIKDSPRTFRTIDPRTEDFPPFSHRVHVLVSENTRLRAAFARELLAVFDRAYEIDGKLPQPYFAAWAGATKDLLLALGLEWDSARETYVIRKP
jgi:hypothetical protein